MRTQQEVLNLLGLLYVTKQQFQERVAESDAADCDCGGCALDRAGLTATKVQIDTLLYVLGLESGTEKFVKAVAEKEVDDLLALEEKYAAQNEIGVQTNARFN